jgi:hypothetical protein
MRDLLALADEGDRRRWDELSLGYTESPGDPALRTAISEIRARLAGRGSCLLRRRGPGTVFADAANHFRLGFGRKNMPQALDRLEQYAARTLR